MHFFHMYLLLSTIQNTERGKKINAAVQKTGTIVANTGKAVGKFPAVFADEERFHII